MAADEKSLEEAACLLDSLNVEELDMSDPGRIRLLRSVNNIYAKLEKPAETLARWMLQETSLQLTLRIAVDMKLFHHLYDPSEPQTLDTLASSTQSEPAFLERLLRVFCSIKMLSFDSLGRYHPTALSREAASPEAEGLIRHTNDVLWRHYPAIPKYFRVNGYKSPNGPHDGPWQSATGTTQPFFEWLKGQPSDMADFANIMQGRARTYPPWVSYTPTEKLLSQDDGESPVLVDIGGGLGHDVAFFLQKHPETSGRLYVQDRPEVIEQTKSLDSGINKVGKDMFSDPPIKDARLYFMHSVLHDWSDDDCRTLLLNTKKAMRKGYSQLLVGEIALPDSGGSRQQAGVDITMMAVLGSRERTEKDWRALLKSAGFDIVEVFNAPGDVDQVFVADVSD